MARNRRQIVSGTQNVQHMPENTPLPTGDNQAAYVGDEVESKSASEETATTEEVGEPVESKKRGATGPRTLKPIERKVVAEWLNKVLPADVAYTTEVTFADLPKDLKPFFQASMKDNVVQRGVFNAVYDETTHQLTGVHLTELGIGLYNKAPTGRVSRGATKEKVARESTRALPYPSNLRLRKMVEGNPRQTDSHGAHSFDLYVDGMTYEEYLSIKDYVKHSNKDGVPFHGPKRMHFQNDLDKGFIALYYEDKDEYLPDGSPNPEFWWNPTTVRLKKAETTEAVQEEQPAE